MQPYFLPYIGYFTLINSVDKFVFYNDVQYIKRGWVNRNRIKKGNQWQYIIMPVKKAHFTVKINDVHVVESERERDKLKKAIMHCYQKAPYYKLISDLIFTHIIPGENISKINISLIVEICNYLDINTEIYLSSKIPKDNSLKGENKIIEICRSLEGTQYINPIGGIKLYSSVKFQDYCIQLKFLKMNEITYSQGKYDFIPNLSIVDVLMWNSKDHVKEMLNNYELI